MPTFYALLLCLVAAAMPGCSRSPLPSVDRVDGDDDGDPTPPGDPNPDDMTTGDPDGDSDTVVLPGIDPAATGYLAYNDPVLGRKVTDDDLIERSGDINASNTTIERCVYRGPIHINGSGVTLRGCLIEISASLDSSGPAVYLNADNITLSYLTIRRQGNAIQGTGIDMAVPDTLEIDHVRIENTQVGIIAQGDNVRIQDSALLGITTTGITMRSGNGHIYTNDTIEVATTQGTTGILLGSSAIDGIDIIGSRINGGEKHIIVTSASAVFEHGRVLRSIMNGHTDPIYDAVNSTSGVIIVHLPSEQTDTPSSILWPIEGDDASHWHGTTDLSPSREDQAIIP